MVISGAGVNTGRTPTEPRQAKQAEDSSKIYFTGLIHNNINNNDDTPSLFSSWQELKQESSGCEESLLGLPGIIKGWTGCQKHSLVSIRNTHISTL